MSFGPDSFDSDSIIFQHNEPMSLLERLGYAKQLVFSRTKLEFRLLWNKVFQKEDEELGWLLNPYRNQQSGQATMMTSFNKNLEESYQYDIIDVQNSLGRERVTIYHRGVATKKGASRKREEEKSLGESLLQIARYMGIGAYMTSTSFPSPFLPANDTSVYGGMTMYGDQSMYSMSKIW